MLPRRIQLKWEEPMNWEPNEDCPKCEGLGWVWWDMLAVYDGPAVTSGVDQTKYIYDNDSHRQTKPIQ